MRFKLPFSLVRSASKRVRNVSLSPQSRATTSRRKLRRLLVENLEERRVLAAFTPGNLAIYRIGDGSAALSNASTAVFVDEYTPSGTLVQSIAMPTTASGGNFQLTASGSATSEGMLTRSADGQFLVLTGYASNTGVASIASSTSATAARTIGRIDSQGNVNTTTTTTAFSGNNIRGAASLDGTSIYATGGNTGLVLQTLGGSGAGTVVSNSTTNLRNVNIFGNQLYVSSGSGTLRLASVGTGVPTNTGNTATNLPGFPTTGSPYQFFFADLSAAVAGVDTVYVADDAPGTIQKYSLVGANWTSNGSISTGTTTVRGLTATVSGNSVTLFGATGANLVSVTDATGYNVTPTATATQIATAGTNRVFRGVALVPAVTSSTSFAIAADSGSTSKNEGQSGTTTYSFTITRSGTTTGSNDVTWTVSGDGANAASTADFVGNAFQTGTASFAAGELTKTITINVQGDTAVESNEGFRVTLSNPTNGASLTTASASSTIVNDDASIAIQLAGVSLAEGNSGTTNFVFNVTRLGDTTQSQTVDFALVGSGSNPANAADFVGNALPTGTVTFAATETTKTITIPVAGDVTVETDETFTVSISNPPSGAILGNASSIGTIVDDDAVANVAISALQTSLPEGNTGATTTFSFTITRSNLLTGVTSVDWAVTGTGTNQAAATDFVGGVFPSGSVTFAANETTKTVTVDVAGDATIEPNEDFVVTLSNITGGAITGASVTNTILNDDASIAVSAGQVSLVEGNSGSTAFTFTVTRTGFQGAGVSFDYAVTGSGTSQASASDFVGGTLPTGTLTFAADETTKSITINVAGDTTIEPDEGFTVTLSNVTAPVAVGTASASSTILNDDLQVLAAGDVVITGINTTNPDQFSFVSLVDIAGSSTLIFTDNAFNGTTSTLGTTEGNVTYVAPSGGLAKGTKVVLEVASGVVTFVSGPGTATATTNFALNSAGDNIFAYQGTSANPNFLFAVNTNTSYLTSGATSASLTYLPTGLTIGTSAVAALGSAAAVANAEYVHATGTSGSASAIRALVANSANWTSSGTAIALNTSNFTLNAAPTITDVVDQNTNEDAALTGVAFTIDDVDTPVGNLTITATSSNTTLVPNANLVITGSGPSRTLAITPAANLNGQSVITITVSDSVGSSSDTFTLTVNSVNDAPVSANATDTTNEDTTLTFAPADFAFSDPSDSPANLLQSVLITSLPALGTLSFNGTPIASASLASPFVIAAANIGQLTYAPVAETNGTAYASFRFRVQDNGGTDNGGVDTSLGENTITIDVTPVNDAPVASNGTLTTNEDTTQTGTLVANDVDDVNLTYSIVDSSLANGTVTITNASTGAFSFAPNANFFGTGSFTFKANDGTNDSNVATINITINPVNDIPVIAINAGLAATVSSTTTVSSTILRTTDVDNSAGQLTYTLSSLPTLGTLRLNNVNITSTATTFTQADIEANLLTYAAGSTVGADSFAFSVADPSNASVSGSFSISVNPSGNLAPTGLNLSNASVDENRPIGTAVGNFSSTDPNSGDTFTYTLVAGTGSTDNSSFSIVGNQLRTAASFNFEAKSSYSIRVQTADQGNLTFEQVFTIAVIDVAEAPVITVTSGNKVYDRLAYVPTATVTGDSGPVSNPTLTYTFYVGTGTTGANLGSVAPINAGTYTVVAAFAGNANYLAGTSSPTTFQITPKQLTATLTAQNKVYDGLLAATVTYGLPVGGVIAGDTVTISGGAATFANKNVGNAKVVTGSGATLSGASVANYSLTSTAPTGTANITQRTLTSNAIAQNKVYDGTIAATLGFSDDRITGDTFTYNYTASFPDKNIGNLKRVNFSNVSITGGDAGNYALSINTLAIIRANITARPITVTATGSNKTYDGLTTATVTLSDNRVTGDALTTSFTGAAFVDRNAGVGKTINVSGIAISGTDAFNYTLQNTTATTTATISPRNLTGTASASNKVYDGSPAATVSIVLSGVLPIDSGVTGSATGNFANKNVGTAKTVTVGAVTLLGTGASNYNAPTVTNPTANITARSLTATATGNNKVYDGNSSATVTIALGNTVSGDDISGTASASFADKQVGQNKPVTVGTVALSGADAGNYTVGSANNTTANITQRSLVVSATGSNKVYDGNNSTTVVLSDNRVSGDSLTVNFATATFADKSVGTAKPISVTGITVTGTDAANYSFNTSASTTANISQRALLVTAAATDKVYDGNRNASVTLSDNRVSGDVFTISSTSSLFSDKNVGVGKSVDVAGISLAGADAANYSFNTSASTTASISTLAVTPSVTVNNKNFDGNTSATIATRTLIGAVPGDDIALTGGTASFVDSNPGLNKTVNVTGLSLTGNDALNYSAPTSTTSTASIFLVPTVNNVSLNGGATQRSQLTSITVTFNAPVTLSPGAFIVGQYSLTSFNTLVRNIDQSQIIVSPNAGSATSFTITFGAGLGVQTRAAGNSLVDGNYRLTVDATKVTSSTGTNMTGNHLFGHNPNLAGHNSFFRLYGDSDGDGDVDGIDRIAFNRAATTYNAAMDYNGNGTVDSSDFSFFSANLNKRRSRI